LGEECLGVLHGEEGKVVELMGFGEVFERFCELGL